MLLIGLVAPWAAGALSKDFYTAKELGEKLGWLTEKGSVYYVSEMIKLYQFKEKPDYCQHKKNLYYYTPKTLEDLEGLNLDLDGVKEYLKKSLQNDVMTKQI